LEQHVIYVTEQVDLKEGCYMLHDGSAEKGR